MENEFVVCNSILNMSFCQIAPFLAQNHTVRHRKFTTEYLAGQYAYYASTSIDVVNKRTFKNELKFLKELGVNFNHDEALSFAVYFSGMLDNPTSTLRWY